MSGFCALIGPLLRRPTLVVEAATARFAPVSVVTTKPTRGKSAREDARPWRSPAEAGPRGRPGTGRCDGGPAGRGWAGRAVSLHDTVGVTTLGGKGLHRPQGFPEWLPLTCWDVLTSWPARWTPSPGRGSVHIGILG